MCYENTLPSKMVCHRHLTAVGKHGYLSTLAAIVLHSEICLLVGGSELTAGALLSNPFAKWELAIQFLSLGCREQQYLFNLEFRKLEQNWRDRCPEPFHLPFIPRGMFFFTIAFKALTSLTAAAAVCFW